MPVFAKRLAAGLFGVAVGVAPVLASAQPGPGGHGGPPPHGVRGGHGGAHPPVAPGRTWHKGDRFDGRGAYIDDWHAYHGLYAPPPGYRWVDYNGSFILTAIATGVIANILRP